jgi:hypothetical protein
MNGRTAFSDAITTAFAATLLLGIVTGDPTDGYGVWAARFSVSMAASYLFWRRRYRR